MGEATLIEWTHHTWSPWRGCTKVSPGCANCYAEALSHRNPAVLGEWGPDGRRVVAAESSWKIPERWDRAAKKAGERRRVFFSLGDPFEDREELVNPRIGLFELIARTPSLDWLLLTKRPEFAATWLENSRVQGLWPVPNVWLGVSVEDQKRADERIPKLLEIPAAVRFLSIEPLLGPVNIRGYFGPQSEGQWMNVVECGHSVHDYGVNWVIVGGESGPGARPCDLAWIRSVVRQCREAGVPAFIKQLGADPYHCPSVEEQLAAQAKFSWRIACDGYREHIHLSDPKGGDTSEWPEDLRVREFPAPREA